MVDTKTRLEGRPGPGAENVADHLPDLMPPVFSAAGLIDQITTQLTDIVHGGGPVTANVTPELAGAELAPDRNPRGAADRRPPTHAQTRGVVQRQRGIQNIRRLHVQGDQAETGGSEHPPPGAKHPGLGLPRGARGVEKTTRLVEKNQIGRRKWRER